MVKALFRQDAYVMLGKVQIHTQMFPCIGEGFDAAACHI